MHGFSRITKDIDIWVNDDKQNWLNLGKAMAIFGYEDLCWEEMQFVPGWTDFYIGNGIILDILITMKGFEGFTFEECHTMASIAEIENIKIPFLHINHLIANKEAVNCAKDENDVKELKKIKQLRKEMRLE